jgi:hypothetical protein
MLGPLVWELQMLPDGLLQFITHGPVPKFDIL